VDEPLTHLDERGETRMVDVGAKPVTARMARAEGFLTMPPGLLARLASLPKGNAFEAARLAGVMAAKKTGDLIPLCHPLPLDQVALSFETNEEKGSVRVLAEARCHGRTGVEMEAMTAVSVALLTLYDMAKASARDMTLGPIRLLRKEGGKSGVWERSLNR